MEINIAVVDDRRTDSEKLQRAIHKWFDENQNLNHNLKNITCFTNGEAILKDFLPGKFQIVFMDIIMNNMNGIETSKKLRELDPQLIIVFITTSSEYAFDAFPLHPFDYIIKPFNCEKIYHVLSEAIRIFDAPDPAITVRVSRSRYKIRLKCISEVLALTAIVFSAAWPSVNLKRCSETPRISLNATEALFSTWTAFCRSIVIRT